MNQGSGFRRNWRANRTVFLIVCVVIALALIVASQTGLLSPVTDILAIPLNAVSGVFDHVALTVNDNVAHISDIQTLQKRIADLETALALYQSELVELREVNSDYQRLADLLKYTTSVQNQQFVTADVIADDESGVLRTITVDRGTRDGIAVGMPVVTGQGLVGRVIQVTANAARIMLVTEPSSAVSARLQTSRVEGTVRGQLAGTLEMDLIPLDSQVNNGDLVITSGLGGNFPPGIAIGQVTSVGISSDGLNQVAQVRSLINFDTLEFVLIVTNFQPVDLSVFDQPTPSP
ncbi:MAG TPA: rod shape-determining protein MreC [Phototrophicaceae bacterium]|nr:rod shape-determining protein MreC [Phototrophicaceae bacterium]